MERALRVLVVDDDADVVRHIVRSLTAAGCSVATAASGPEAMRHLERESVDVVVTDVLMPGMSGFQLIRWLRERHPDLKIAALSGGGPFSCPEELLAGATRVGADAEIGKPVSSSTLVRTVERLGGIHR